MFTSFSAGSNLRFCLSQLSKLKCDADAWQEAQKRQMVDVGAGNSVPPGPSAVDSRQLEQLKAVLMQQIQQQQRQQRDNVIHDDRRLPTDRLPTEFDLRERQRHDEIRRRQVSRVMLILMYVMFHYVVFLKPTVSVPPRGSHRCRKFGHCLTS